MKKGQLKKILTTRCINRFALIIFASIALINIVPVAVLIYNGKFDLLFVFNLIGLCLLVITLNVYRTIMERRLYQNKIEEDDLYLQNRFWIYMGMVLEFVLTVLFAILSI